MRTIACASVNAPDPSCGVNPKPLTAVQRLIKIWQAAGVHIFPFYDRMPLIDGVLGGG